MGVYGGYASWADRPGKFRTPGLGQVHFPSVFYALRGAGFSGWAVLEWEDPLLDSDLGARVGGQFIQVWCNLPELVKPEKSFDDFAGSSVDEKQLRVLLGLAPAVQQVLPRPEATVDRSS